MTRRRFSTLAACSALLATLFFTGACRDLPPTGVAVRGSDLIPERLHESSRADEESGLAIVPAMEWRQGDPVKLAELGGPDCLWRRGDALIPLPLLATEVQLTVTGPMLRGELSQRFLNAADEVIEAIYVFPLPEGAAVHAMELRVGERRIVAAIKEKAEARRRYEAARVEGRRAALVEQERPNLFTTSVANILPGEEVVVQLTYSQELEFADGRFGLHFPLTFTPRYLPASMRPTIQNAEASRPADPSDGRRITPPFVRPDGPGVPGAIISLDLNAGLALHDLDSPSHAVVSRRTGPHRWSLDTKTRSVPADRDFRVEWRPDLEDGPATALFIERDDAGAYALLMLLPPESPVETPRPTDTLFVVDISGSMDGPSIAAARVALLTALERMGPEDRFAFLLFSDTQRFYADRFLPADRENLGRARRWVERLSTEGGTEIHAALVRALLFTSRAAADEPERLRRMVFITDGAVGNEAQVLETVAAALGETRIHAVGIGPSPNRYLMRELAKLGRGSCAFIDEGAATAPRMKEFLARFDRPLLTDLWLGWRDVAVTEIYPARLPDLYPGEALFVSARLVPDAAQGGVLTVKAGDRMNQDLPFNEAGVLAAGTGLGLRWARAKVGSLMESLHRGAEAAAVREEVIEVALAHDLVTRYTSLVAEEKLPVTETPGIEARVPNALPRGSTLLNGSLPRGGSLAPLRRAAGLAFAAIALGFFALAWRRP
jgi:Ca-activated chloride channel homolog